MQRLGLDKRSYQQGPRAPEPEGEPADGVPPSIAPD
jgi:hypothetical protein